MTWIHVLDQQKENCSIFFDSNKMTLQVVLTKKEATKANKNPLFPEGERYEFLP